MKKTIAALLIAGACALAASTAVKAEEASALSATQLPDWNEWKCEKVHTSHEIIETYACSGPGQSQMSRILLKTKGSKEPFLIGWGFDERAENPKEKAYAALNKEGRWIVGARGTGFTTEENGGSITFYVFLDDQFSTREQIAIKLPKTDQGPAGASQVTKSSGNEVGRTFQAPQKP